MTKEVPQIYLICPVNKATAKEKEFLDAYVNSLEQRGLRVHYPPRDVNQEDSIGLRILTEHREAMRQVKATHIYWNGKSTGSFFDLGMCFMADKPLILANPEIIRETEFDEFDRAILEQPLRDYDLMDLNSHLNASKYEIREQIKKIREINYLFRGLTKEALFELGMMFMTEKPLVLANREEVEKQRTPSKSFQNVLLALDDLARAG